MKWVNSFKDDRCRPCTDRIIGCDDKTLCVEWYKIGSIVVVDGEGEGGAEVVDLEVIFVELDYLVVF